jgi:5-methylcytosine-specific restriction endonuclease McrA
MCKVKVNAGACSELGSDPAKWSRTVPLPKPAEAHLAMENFEASYKALLSGEIDEAKKLLTLIPSIEMQTWFDVHAQNISTPRFKGLGSLAPTIYSTELDLKKTFSHLSRQIYRRDYFHCRYCGSKVAPRSFFTRFSKMIGDEYFHLGRSNKDIPGIYLLSVATLDHVTPHRLGGRTDEENLVTSCWPCNYGKMEFTVDQLGMDDPRLTPPIEDDEWVTFVSGNS